MKIYVIIPAYNEEVFLERTLASLVSQTQTPQKLLVVNDSSTDRTAEVAADFARRYPFIETIDHPSEKRHQPGSKIIEAFLYGLNHLDSDFDILCKFDADLEFPPDYIQQITKVFKSNPKVGMAGGFCYVENKGQWLLENLTSPDHLRGALKAYRKTCFESIGGLRNAMGWDTADELLAQYYGWKVQTLPELKVKHLKKTGQAYTKRAGYKQGEAFFKLRYGFVLSLLALGKLSVKKKEPKYFFQGVIGFFAAKRRKATPLVSKKEGKYIRSFRWKNIRIKFRTAS